MILLKYLPKSKADVYREGSGVDIAKLRGNYYYVDIFKRLIWIYRARYHCLGR